MNNQTVFCPECRQNINYLVKEQNETAELKGEVYNFASHTAYCEKCGSEVYVPELSDENLKTLYDVYRQRHDIISLDDIRTIPEKYNIGKRPLSLLLGWGEQTFSRYFDGDMPTKQYSEILKQIYSDPAYFLALLERNKDTLKSEITYRKSKNVTERLLGVYTEQKSKIDIVVDYLLSQCQDITHLSLHKTLYYIQGFFYAFYHTFIFIEDCEAWVHGPVYRQIYKRYVTYCFDPIDGVSEFDISALSGEEKTLLDSVIRYICCYSGKTLEFFTHTETPWVSARGELPADAPSDKIISKQAISDYFVSVRDKYRMLTPANIKDYAQDMFARM